jgi:hypothetical protein
MNRTMLQALAELRLRDAEVLLDNGMGPTTYWATCIECALKACIAKQFREHEIPDKKLVQDFYTHRLEELLRVSGVRSAMEQQSRENPAFGISWNTVRDWSEASRYEIGLSDRIAAEMHLAVADAESGVLPWLKTQW